MSEYGDRRDAIICPYCGKRFDDEDYCHVSYHGTEDGPKEQDCGSCGLTFEVEEHVSRTWTTIAIRQEVAR